MELKSYKIFVKSLVLISMIFLFACNNIQIKEQDIIEKKIDSLLSQMTLEEKVNMIHASSSFTSGGVERLGIPELIMSDGPHGVRPEHGRDWELDNNINDSATYLPTGIALAATWNTKLGYSYGKVIGSEANYRGKDVILGPGVNIIRSPLNGRNFEYLSEDPYLASRMAVGYIKGVQEMDVAACVKHFVANNQEQFRHSVNVKMSERALHEIYLPAFKASVEEANVLTIMSAYNQYWGQFCSHNDYLVNQVLKTDWGFDGILISDWNAVHDTKEALLYGTDIEMGTDLGMLPNPDYNKFYLADSALAMIKTGEIEDSFVDEKVRRILRVMFSLKKFDKKIEGSFATKEHKNIALKVAEEGIVLLKNDGVLPIKAGKIKTIAVIGNNAIRKQAMGGGSSQMRPQYERTLLEELKKQFGENIEIKFTEGYKVDRSNNSNKALVEEAKKIAKESDITIFVGGWIHNWTEKGLWEENVYDAEEIDKPDMQMPFGQDELITELLSIDPNTIIVLYGGGPVDMSKWVNEAKAIVQAWYPGMEGGTALTNILLGKINPSGKLPMTFPKKLNDSPAHALGEYPGKNNEVTYNEDIFVGYRYFDTYNIEAQFAFGHGLSYTSFEYSDLKVINENKQIEINFKLKNVGQVRGAEIAQVYVHDIKASVKRPIKELKGFEKVFLAPGESKLVELYLENEAFKYYDEEKSDWVLEPGVFKISVGSSSVVIKLSKDIELK